MISEPCELRSDMSLSWWDLLWTFSNAHKYIDQKPIKSITTSKPDIQVDKSIYPVITGLRHKSQSPLPCQFCDGTVALYVGPAWRGESWAKRTESCLCTRTVVAPADGALSGRRWSRWGLRSAPLQSAARISCEPAAVALCCCVSGTLVCSLEIWQLNRLKIVMAHTVFN